MKVLRNVLRKVALVISVGASVLALLVATNLIRSPSILLVASAAVVAASVWAIDTELRITQLGDDLNEIKTGIAEIQDTLDERMPNPHEK